MRKTDCTMQNRRQFLAGAGLAAMTLTAGGGTGMRLCGGGGTMSGYVAPKLKRVRVGIVGVGSRGTYALKRLAFMPGVEIAAFCDIKEAAMKRSRDFLAQKKLRPAREFFGPEAYRDLCQWDGVDVVYACVPWKLHAPVALAAMRADKHAFVEVPATMDVDSCWELVETSEATRRHCMMLENCCYGEHEMLALNMCRTGALGETVYGEAGYLHSGATRGFKLSEFRAEWYQEHRGNYYPTHGLGPVAQYMNINRGDRFDYLNSMETKSIADFIREGDPRWNGENLETYKKYLIGGYNSSLIRTVNGKTMLIQHDVLTPRPYSRMYQVVGSDGYASKYPVRQLLFRKGMLDKTESPDYQSLNAHAALPDSLCKAMLQKYLPPFVQELEEKARQVGGHGGMDFIMDYRLVYCLRNGLPLDMDVYDMAEWCCLGPLTRISLENGSAPVAVPDFTRGAWNRVKGFRYAFK